MNNNARTVNKQLQEVKPSTECTANVPAPAPIPFPNYPPGPAPAPFPFPNFPPGPAPFTSAPTPNVATPTEPYLFELHPLSSNMLYAATWSAAQVTSGSMLTMTMTSNVDLVVYVVTKDRFLQFESCFQESLPSGIDAVAVGGSSSFGMKSGEHLGPCLPVGTDPELVTSFFYASSESSKVERTCFTYT